MPLLYLLRRAFPELQHVFADGAYRDFKLTQALELLGKWTIEIVQRCDHTKGFEALPRRWVVERTLAWLYRNRRLAKDFEASIESAKAWIFLASLPFQATQLARLGNVSR